jgi:hypothetical protein
MNIIQIQDRLKGLPDQSLVNYVEQPMGEVPIYLALGELQRRKEMRERFQAIPTPETTTVSEKLVAESKPPMQMGLGGINKGAGIDPRQLAASGIAANPQSAVGGTAMMKEGGIVGYKAGDIIKRAKDSEGLKKLKEFFFGSKGKKAVKGEPVYEKGPTIEPSGYVGGSPEVPAVKNFALRNKGTTALIGGYGGLTAYDAIFGEDGSISNLPEKGTSKEEFDKAIEALNKPKKEAGDKPKLTEKQTLEKRAKEIQNIIGPDEGRKKIDERLAKKEKDAVNMALINAGLGMAAGQSPNFLDNLVAGAGAGVESYTDTQADIFELQNELAKADRSERIAIIGEALKDGRIDRELAVKLRAAVIAGPQVAPMAAPAAKEIADINKEIRRLQVAEQEQISAGNTDAAAKIRTMILNRIKVKNEAVEDSVSLSTDPSTYSSGTGATNDPFNLR